MEANDREKLESGPLASSLSQGPVPSARIDRRAFLARGAGAIGATATAWVTPAAAADGSASIPPWMRKPGKPLSGYGQPSQHEEKVLRTLVPNYGPLDAGSGTSRTPLQLLEGAITPSGLHFERHHNGIPEIDPAQHRLLIHGLVRRPLVFDMAALLRYPIVSRTCFIECAGNSALNTLPKAPQVTAGMIHGLVSCSEWTGVPLRLLLDEADIEPNAKWLLAEGADSAAMSRSIPVAKAFDDALIALYQNGERIRPEQGYPLRLVLPGFEGNMNVKWLRRLKATEGPTHTKDETSKYTDLLRDGKARQFTFVMGVKSVITHPSGGMTMQGPGVYQVSGIAWSGAGRVTRVEVSSDGGENWTDASFDPSLPQSLTRFRLLWEWNGAPAILQSRATDDKGRVQESRVQWTAQYSPGNRFHNSMIQSWAINTAGKISNVYL